MDSCLDQTLASDRLFLSLLLVLLLVAPPPQFAERPNFTPVDHAIVLLPILLAFLLIAVLSPMCPIVPRRDKFWYCLNTPLRILFSR